MPHDDVVTLAQQLAALGVKRARVADGAIDLEFFDRAPMPAHVAPGVPSLEELMEVNPSTDPLDDAVTFGGKKPPSYRDLVARDRNRDA